jgi:small conductance mechanosensitive channel
MVYYLVLAVVLIAVLGLFGIETTSLVAVLATAGLAVGLALQGTLSNFSSGVMLLLFRPFRAGDFVDVAGVKGSVVEIGIFTTVLKTPDNVKIIVPNSSIYGSTITNYAAYDEADGRVLKDPQPVIAVAELAESSVNFVVRPWCNASDYWTLRFDLTRQIKAELEKSGCSIPFPQHDVHVINGSAAS